MTERYSTWITATDDQRDHTIQNCEEIAEVEGLNAAIISAFNDGADTARALDKLNCDNPGKCTCRCGSAQPK